MSKSALKRIVPFEGINCALCIINCALREGLDVLDVVFEGVLADSACFES